MDSLLESRPVRRPIESSIKIEAFVPESRSIPLKSSTCRELMVLVCITVPPSGCCGRTTVMNDFESELEGNWPEWVSETLELNSLFAATRQANTAVTTTRPTMMQQIIFFIGQYVFSLYPFRFSRQSTDIHGFVFRSGDYTVLQGSLLAWAQWVYSTVEPNHAHSDVPCNRPTSRKPQLSVIPPPNC